MKRFPPVQRAWRHKLGLVAAISALAALPALAQSAPALKPSKFSKAPIDITTNAYGAFKHAPHAPKIGDVIKDFSLPKARGGEFTLSKALKSGPVLIMFYRGHW